MVINVKHIMYSLWSEMMLIYNILYLSAVGLYIYIYIYTYVYTVQVHQDLDLKMLRSVISNMPSTTAVVAEILTSM